MKTLLLAPLSAALLAALLPTLVAGCTVYKSSDRDSFNSTALDGAPKPKTLAAELLPAGAKTCLFSEDPNAFGTKPVEITNNDTKSNLVTITVRALTKSNHSLACEFEKSTLTSAELESEVLVSRAQVEQLATQF